jgi:hypothetical protein
MDLLAVGGYLGCGLSRSFSRHLLHKLPSGSLSNCCKGLLEIFPSKNYSVGMRSCTLGNFGALACSKEKSML